MAKKIQQKWTNPEEGLQMLKQAEQKHKGYENIPSCHAELVSASIPSVERSND